MKSNINNKFTGPKYCNKKIKSIMFRFQTLDKHYIFELTKLVAFQFIIKLPTKNLIVDQYSPLHIFNCIILFGVIMCSFKQKFLLNFTLYILKTISCTRLTKNPL